jgi:hypothetical protein
MSNFLATFHFLSADSIGQKLRKVAVCHRDTDRFTWVLSRTKTVNLGPRE